MALDGQAEAVNGHACFADEDAGIVGLLHAVLADDFDITVANDGPLQAVELAASMAPDLVMLDLGMPILDGFAACRLIHVADPDLPIVILSGPVPTRRRSARRSRLAPAITSTKPFTVSQLRSRLRANLLRAQ